MVTSFILSFVLPLIWAFYFYKKDCHPEPIPYLVFAFFLGIVSAALSLFFQTIILNSIGFKINDPHYLHVFIAATLEEFFKFFVIFLLIFPLKVFDEPVDAMIYMIFSAFGFAFIENLIYLIGHATVLENEEIPPEYVIFMRFLSPNFLHIIASALVGFGYSYAIQIRSFFIFIFSLIGASFLHFLHNYFIILLGGGGILLVIPILWAFFVIVLSEIDFIKTKHERRIANLKPYT